MSGKSYINYIKLISESPLVIESSFSKDGIIRRYTNKGASTIIDIVCGEVGFTKEKLIDELKSKDCLRFYKEEEREETASRGGREKTDDKGVEDKPDDKGVEDKPHKKRKVTNLNVRKALKKILAVGTGLAIAITGGYFIGKGTSINNSNNKSKHPTSSSVNFNGSNPLSYVDSRGRTIKITDYTTVGNLDSNITEISDYVNGGSLTGIPFIINCKDFYSSANMGGVNLSNSHVLNYFVNLRNDIVKSAYAENNRNATKQLILNFFNEFVYYAFGNNDYNIGVNFWNLSIEEQRELYLLAQSVLSIEVDNVFDIDGYKFDRDGNINSAMSRIGEGLNYIYSETSKTR